MGTMTEVAAEIPDPGYGEGDVHPARVDGYGGPRSTEDLAAAVEQATEAIEFLQRLDPDRLDRDQVVQWAEGVERLRRMTDGASSVVADHVDTVRPFVDQGFLSAKAWLQHRLKISNAEAHRRVQVARAQRRLGHWCNAHLAGQVSTEQMEQMARVAANPRLDPERLWMDSWRLLGDAFDHDYDGFAERARRWESLADADGDRDRATRERERRHFSLQPRPGGGWRLTGALDDVRGAELNEVWANYVDAEWRTDWAASGAKNTRGLPRTQPQRCADALVEMARAAAGADPDGSRGHPTANILIDEDTFNATITDQPIDPDRYRDVVCRTRSGVQLRPADAVNAALLGHVRRVVYDSQGVVVDLGRRSRLFRGSSREAVMLLATSCSWVGCDRPVEWCDADHSITWAAHGATVPRNGVPLCRRHHVMKGRGYRVHRDEHGHWHTYDPDGTEIS